MEAQPSAKNSRFRAAGRAVTASVRLRGDRPVSAAPFVRQPDGSWLQVFEFGPEPAGAAAGAKKSAPPACCSSRPALEGKRGAAAPAMTASQMAEARLVFKELDTDGGGTISRAELHSGISKMPAKTPSREAVDAMLTEFDEEGDGDLDFAEFLVLFVSL